MSPGSSASNADDDELIGGIDELLPELWPEPVADALALWKQGDLLESPGITWLGPQGSDTVAPTDLEWDWAPVTAGERSLRAPYGVICSQTCDIAADGPGRRHPFVEISPVFNGSGYSSTQRIQIQEFGMPHLIALTHAPDDDFWVVDLRLTVPISKGLLANREPRPAFSSEEDRLNFAEALAARHRRPAVSALISESLPGSLEQHIKNNRTAPPEWYLNVAQLRIQLAGDRLDPTAATVYVVGKIPLEATQIALWRTWTKLGKTLLSADRIKLDPLLFVTLDTMTARQYSASMPIRVPSLGRPPRW